MGLNIKNKKVEASVRELCKLTGRKVTDAIGIAVANELRSIGQKSSSMGLADALMSISKECASLPNLDTRSADEILGYNNEGGF